ncbi:phytolongin Phyl1.1-like [Cornus florida]|uniref:phytolongin Phyl1.1-like n=1 Tax=Cornus florida TaxID=4283 RepID=UPI0028998345|nr:phytolongin Phyl1.1-like [Cornus florida]XP_059636580.1 phytolongin Phyl1.1-like [Cornus florida]
MGSIQNTVHYCCVSKGTRILYAYSGGDHEIENLAARCLERTPPYHTWYFHTMCEKTFGFLMEDGYVYFVIMDEGLGNSGVLQFLENVRSEFKKVARKGSSRSISNLNSLCIEEQLVPVIRHLITTLERVSNPSNEWQGKSPSPHHMDLSPSSSNNANEQIEVSTSTKIPLLGKSSKQEKRKMKDHVIAIRDIELEEHRKSTDRGVKGNSGTLDSDNQGAVVSSGSLQKDMGSMRIRSGTQSIRKKWCRLVRIVLAVDAAVCLVLFVIWLGICGGTDCIH